MRSVKCERSFSALRRVHSYSRLTMYQSRLSNLSILTIKPDILSELDNNVIIDEFSTKIPTRYI